MSGKKLPQFSSLLRTNNEILLSLIFCLQVIIITHEKTHEYVHQNLLLYSYLSCLNLLFPSFVLYLRPELFLIIHFRAHTLLFFWTHSRTSFNFLLSPKHSAIVTLHRIQHCARALWARMVSFCSQSEAHENLELAHVLTSSIVCNVATHCSNSVSHINEHLLLGFPTALLHIIRTKSPCKM